MNKEIKQYISDFETVFNGEPWYGKSLMSVVKTANSKKVYQKQNPEAHSAYEITYHLYAWRDLLVKRLNGDTKSKISMDSAEDWSPLPKDQTAATWKKLLAQLEQNQKELLAALPKWKDADLDKNFAGTAYSLRTHLNGQLQHDIYHIGQIALALKNG